jgi:hypothetical protein
MIFRNARRGEEPRHATECAALGPASGGGCCNASIAASVKMRVESLETEAAV